MLQARDRSAPCRERERESGHDAALKEHCGVLAKKIQTQNFSIRSANEMMTQTRRSLFIYFPHA